MKLPIKTATVNLDVEYEGWKLEIRTNPPFGKFVDSLKKMESGKTDNNVPQMMEGMYDLLETILLSWNFVDEAGRALPPNRAGFALLPIDLLALTCLRVQEAIVKLPLGTRESSPNG